MDEQNEGSDIIRQMDTYNFNAPIKVTILFDEAETNEFNKSVENSMDNCFENPATQTFPTNNLELLSKCIDDHYSSNVCFDTMNNTFNVECETHYETGTLTSKVMNPHINNVATNNDINHRIPIWSNTSFPIESIVHSQGNNNNHQHSKHSTRMGLETHKTNILYLLDKVSYNLIEISKCYYTVSRDICDHARYQRAKEYYRYFKHKLFNNSYNILIFFMLPLENHPIFMEKFINRTIALAFSKSWYNISNDYLIKLIREILDYTKLRKHIESNSNYQTWRRSSTATYKKNESSKTTSKNVINSNIKNEDNGFIHLLSCGPKDREIRISVKPNILNRTQRHTVTSNCITKRQKTGNSFNSEPQSTRNKDNIYHEISSRTEISTHLPNKNTSFAPHETLAYNNLPNNEREVIDLDNDNVNRDNHFATSRSSVSRDSGFISPISTIEYPVDQLGNSRNDVDLFTTSSSVYTTSMNREGLILPGACKVCGLVTTKMCLGCYREYYCSLQCQKKDWNFHKLMCRK
ncbi:putative uncharacterized protein DDB_G0282133 [Nymphalis io]|uniref:putative uncharacterized protein DDB_G0282133 n=1 Tax=Inachis io TaxID=171585 RepID=UPI002169B398|nr:putative uncharacterized protein DDB_G0282133 [Nymphalis io]